jgi:hypothetical protein
VTVAPRGCESAAAALLLAEPFLLLLELLLKHRAHALLLLLLQLLLLQVPQLCADLSTQRALNLALRIMALEPAQ